MKRTGRAATLALLGGLMLLPTMAQARADIQADVVKAMPRLQSSMNGNDCTGAMKVVSPILARKDFPSLDARLQAPILLAATLCEGNSNQIEPALVHARALTALPAAPDVAWRMRFGLELDSQRYGDAVTTLEAIQKVPSAAATIEDNWIFTLAQRFDGKPDDPDFVRLAALISGDGFAPARYNLDFEFLRLAHARHLAKAGKIDEAKAALGKVRLGSLYREASLDPVLRGLLPADFKLSDAYKREIATIEKMSIERPGLLGLPIALSGAQRALGQDQQALATLESARPEGALAKQFSDIGEQHIWWWNAMSQSYKRLGRYDDAVAAFRKAVDKGEMGRANISQTINLGFLQLHFGHYADALATLETIDVNAPGAASPYGLMAWHDAHACAAHMAGKADLAAADLAYVKAHEGDAAAVLTEVLACLGQTDAAAATVIARLDNPQQSAGALQELSTFLEPKTLPESPTAATYKAIAARSDVQAAATRAGGARIFDVYDE
ncbi:hypothetical protein WBP06_17415 [Novosphingobium sp. BL-8H]|uniref:hypothetical protein n=1 Tax=Novosphingobium sp. BL-8H TaxID=3127640 RepID=UPI003757C45B